MRKNKDGGAGGEDCGESVMSTDDESINIWKD